MAVRSDPYIVERELLQIISDHEAILWRQPPDRCSAIACAEDELARARDHHANREAVAAGTQHQLDQLGPLNGLRARGRQERRELEAKLSGDLDAAHETQKAAAVARANLEQLRQQQGEHDRYEAEHGWRWAETRALRDQLAHHWTDVVIACVKADDPLAYGTDKLRHTRQTVASDV
jgi:hypothetical protein